MANETKSDNSSANSATVFLTFDDGPQPGTDDVIGVLEAKQVKGTLFMVGEHVEQSAWRKGVLKSAQNSRYVELANHSNTHAHNKYQQYYKDPDKVAEGFDTASHTLGLSGKSIPARLPGRNTWRVGQITQNDLASGAAADKLARNGYRIYGWDSEWHMKNGNTVESPEEMFSTVKAVFEKKKTKKVGKQIILMHDVMFKASTGGKHKLERFIDLLKNAGYQMETISNY